VRYRTIVADPPWPYAQGAFKKARATGRSMNRRRDSFAVQGPFVARDMPYSTMSLADICDLQVGHMADPSGCRLFLWTTNAFLAAGFEVLKAWGFTYVQTLVWHKTNPPPLPIAVAPSSAEFMLVGSLGSPARLAAWPSSVIAHGIPKAHSRKPDVFIDLIEQVSPGPYVELFARRHRLGWDVWGNESANTAQLAV
jgi:N6-adenosine-specific RNA methylase IME4